MIGSVHQLLLCCLFHLMKIAVIMKAISVKIPKWHVNEVVTVIQENFFLKYALASFTHGNKCYIWIIITYEYLNNYSDKYLWF